MALDKFKAAPLPNPPGQWDAQYMRQVLRVLEIYFSQLDSNTPNHAQQYTADSFVGGSFSGTSVTASDSIDTNYLTSHTSVTGYERANGVWTDALISYGQSAGRIQAADMSVGDIYANRLYGDGRNVWTPYGQLYSTSSQTLPAIDQAVATTYTGNDFPDGITIVSSSRITFAYAGIYQLTFSMQFTSDSTGTELVNVWFRKNGTDISASNSQFSLPARKSAGTPAAIIAVSPFTISIAAGDYIEIMWGSTATTTSLTYIPAVTYSAGVTPAIPATPSVFVDITYVSAKFPQTVYVAPLPVFGFGQIGAITVATP